MPLIANSNTLNTAFAPAAGNFIAQATGGEVTLLRRNTNADPWVIYDTLNTIKGAIVVVNPVAGAEYQFVPVRGTPTVRADQ